MWDDLVDAHAGRRPVRAHRDRPRRGPHARRAGAAATDAHYVYRRTGLPCRVCGTPIRTECWPPATCSGARPARRRNDRRRRVAPMAEFVGAVDQGTTSTRFMIFDHDGVEVARSQLEHEQILPRSGWVEHNPVEIWERTASTMATALTSADLQPEDLAAVGITNQRETTVVWNRQHRPAVPQRDRLAGHPDGAVHRRARTRRARRHRQAQGRPAARALLRRQQDRVDPRQRRRRARRGREAATRSSAPSTPG